MDGLVLLSLLLLRVEDSLVESVRVHFELNHRFVPLALGIFRTLESDGDLEDNLLTTVSSWFRSCDYLAVLEGEFGPERDGEVERSL